MTIFMNIIQSIILGFVEGITEFLPISSTAHLIITSKLLGIPRTEFQKFFEVFIQAGAILAVVIIYFQYLLKHKELFKKLLLSFIPTAVVGFLLYKTIKNVFFETRWLMILAIFIIGFLFLFLEYLIKNKKIVLKKGLQNLNCLETVLIGLGQSLAIIPGVSRAGVVMLTMMVLGYRRDESASYSFLLAVPTIVAASFFDLYKMRNIIASSQNYLMLLIIGLLSSFMVAYLAIKWLVTYLKNNLLTIFGIYRILLAIILMQVLK